MQYAPMLLLFAFSLSWPRFAIIFRSGADRGLSQSPATLAASAVSVASVGLAISDQGAFMALLLVMAGLLLARLMPREMSLTAVAASCVSFGAYLQLVERAGQM